MLSIPASSLKRSTGRNKPLTSQLLTSKNPVRSLGAQPGGRGWPINSDMLFIIFSSVAQPGV